MIPDDFSDLRRFSARAYKRVHTNADTCGFSDLTHVFCNDSDSLVISADDMSIIDGDSAWGFKFDLPYRDGYMEFHSMVCYPSPQAAFEVARAAIAIFEHGGDLPLDVYAEYV